jgi:hypothetical protein
MRFGLIRGMRCEQGVVDRSGEIEGREEVTEAATAVSADGVPIRVFEPFVGGILGVSEQELVALERDGEVELDVRARCYCSCSYYSCCC